MSTSGSTRPVGRMTCSTTLVLCSSSHGPGVADSRIDLADPLGELLEAQRPVVHGRRQPEAVVDQGLLARAVARVLAPELGHGHVALVEDAEEVLREEVEQGERRLARGPAVEVAAVVLHPAAHPRLGEHLEVVLGAHPQPLGLEQLAGVLELAQAAPQLVLDAEDGPAHPLVARAVVGVGEDHQVLEVVADLAGQHVEGADPLHRVAEELDADGPGLVGRVDLHRVAVDPELAPVEGDVVARVLELDQAPQQGPLLVPPCPGAGRRCGRGTRRASRGRRCRTPRPPRWCRAAAGATTWRRGAAGRSRR